MRHGCESWAIKKAECQRIDAFELWCWRRLLRVPWTARRSKCGGTFSAAGVNGPIGVFSQASCSWWSEGLFGQSFSITLLVQAHRVPPHPIPLAGVLLCSSVHQAFDRPASLLFSCWYWRVKREAMVMTPPSTCDSVVMSCFHGCLAFLHRHFPPQSPPSHPLDTFLHSQWQPSPWNCSIIPILQLQPLPLPGDLHSCLAYVWLQQELSDSRSI